MFKHLFAPSLLAALALTTACQSDSKTDAAATRPDILRAALDTTVAPGDDFFTYANGTWLKQHPIPASEVSWGIGKEVQNEIYARLRQTSIEAAAANAAPGSNQQKIGDFWAAGVDSVKADKLGISPIQPELDRIAALRSVTEIPAATAHLLPLGVNALFGPGVYQDAKNSEKMALYLNQAGLGLPNRDYYFNTDTRTRNIRRDYLRHLTRTFQLLGQDSVKAKADAGRVMALETALAKSSRKLEDLRDPYANYHKMSIGQLNKLTPGLDWQAWLTQLGAKTDTVIVGQPEFYQTAARLLKNTPLADWQAYLSWQLARTYSPMLSRPLADEDFHFYSAVLRGAKAQRPRWKRVLDWQEEAMGEALGQLFVKEYFKPEAKTRYENMVKAVSASFAEHIQKLIQSSF